MDHRAPQSLDRCVQDNCILKDIDGAVPCLRGLSGNLGRAVGHRIGCGGSRRDVAGDLGRRRALFLHRRGDRTGDRVDLADRLFDLLHRGDRFAGGAAHLADMTGDLLGGTRGLGGELLHFAGHHGEAFPGIARARRLDGGVQRQQVGLPKAWRMDARTNSPASLFIPTCLKSRQ
jgi:hypothetical protein